MTSFGSLNNGEPYKLRILYLVFDHRFPLYAVPLLNIYNSTSIGHGLVFFNPLNPTHRPNATRPSEYLTSENLIYFGMPTYVVNVYVNETLRQKSLCVECDV